MFKFDIHTFFNNLREVVNIDSGTTDIVGVTQIGDFFSRKYKTLGLKTRKLYFHDSCAPCLEIISSNCKDDFFDILLIGHMDTVFPHGTALARPLQRLEGRILGPGAADMKSGLILMLFLTEFLINKESNLRFCIALNSSEETGSEHSKNWLRDLGKVSKYCFVFEPGRENGAFVYQRKGGCTMAVTFKGKSAHAGVAPETGCNAIVEAACWICALNTKYKHVKGITINPGVISGGIATNVIADQAQCSFDIRFETLSSFNDLYDSVLNQQKSSLLKGIIVDVKISNIIPPINVTERSKELIKFMNKSAQINNQKIEWIATGGTSDANFIGNDYCSVVDGCGPCGGALHTDKEFVIESTIKTRYEILKNTLVQIEAKLMSDN